MGRKCGVAETLVGNPPHRTAVRCRAKACGSTGIPKGAIKKTLRALGLNAFTLWFNTFLLYTRRSSKIIRYFIIFINPFFRRKIMKENQHTLSRRTFLKGSAAAVGLGAFSTLHFKTVFADDFPSRDINVLVATGEGGAADRVLRSFTSVWKKYLNTGFRPEFYPGAAGQVGYEIYLGRRDPDCYNLLYGNMGPETIMYVLQKPKYKFPDDYVYFCQTDLDPTVVFVRAGSPV
jgi:hypothetical protein